MPGRANRSAMKKKRASGKGGAALAKVEAAARIRHEECLVIIAQLGAVFADEREVRRELEAHLGREVPRAEMLALVEEVESRWRERFHKNLDRIHAREVAALEAVSKEALGAWHASKGGITVTTEGTVKVGDGDETQELPSTETRHTDQPGDPRYLQVAIAAHERRAKMLGLEVPIVIKDTTAPGRDKRRSVEYLRRRYEQKMAAEARPVPEVMDAEEVEA